MHVVSYRRVRHAKLSYGIDADSITAVAPLQSIRSLFYWDLERFAHVVVDVPPGTTQAQVRPLPNPQPPSDWRNIVNQSPFIMASCCLTGWLVFRHNQTFLQRMGAFWNRFIVQRQPSHWADRLRKKYADLNKLNV
eukprot:TRINITY_DN1987_c0_g1_i6.p1 TRINITY_DN1987_c0_g1~~TRINITY_DN1987_c0_g1_i6.p1  ORF type:complete len:152 (-),score=23.80 TRINITY_DN1987_c0_g1_i6:67-474(-)